MDRQARNRNTGLVKNREKTGRSQTLPWWLQGGGVKTTANKIHWPCWMTQSEERLERRREEAIISVLIEADGDNFNDKKDIHL
jgi:hypothetical protein